MRTFIKDVSFQSYPLFDRILKCFSFTFFYTVSSTNEKQDGPKGDDRDTPAEAREAGDFQMILENTKLFAPMAVFKSIGTGSLNKPCVIHTRHENNLVTL